MMTRTSNNQFNATASIQDVNSNCRVAGVEHGRSVLPSPASHPLQALDFDQIQVQVQVRPLTIHNVPDFLQFEERRIAALLNERDQHRPRKAVVLIHPANDLVPDAEVRRLQAEWMEANSAMLQLVVHRIGLIVPNPLWRGAYTAIKWMLGGRLPVPIVAHPSLDAAVRWGIRQVEDLGGTVSQELLDDGVDAIERRRAELDVRCTAASEPPLQAVRPTHRVVTRQALREEAIHVQGLLLSEDDARLHSASADALARFLTAVARDSWADMSLADARRELFEAWCVAGGTFSDELRHTEAGRALIESDLLSVLAEPAA